MKFALVIRFTNSVSSSNQIRDYEIPISINFDKDDVSRLVNTQWIKSMIRRNVKECERCRLRLIYNGRVLNSKTDFKKEALEFVKRRAEEAGEAENIRIYLHCVVGETLSKAELAEESRSDERVPEVSTAPQVIGFDRLLSQGFTQSDVENLRSQFNALHGFDSGTSRGDINDLEEEEQRQRMIREMEERWIESTVTTPNGPPENAPVTDHQAPPPPSQDLDDSHNNEDVLIGMLLGAFLGVLSLIFMIVDDGVFNKRHKMSMAAGVMMNIIFAIVRGQWI